MGCFMHSLAAVRFCTLFVSLHLQYGQKCGKALPGIFYIAHVNSSILHVLLNPLICNRTETEERARVGAALASHCVHAWLPKR